MRRLQYSIREVLVREDGIIPWINRLPNGQSELGISQSFGDFICKNSICSRCLQPTLHLADHVRCAETEFAFADIEPLVPKALKRQFHAFWNRHKWSAKAFARTARLRRSGGSHTQGQLHNLMSCQQNRCYYCYCLFTAEGVQRAPHLDHFVSVLDGGTNDIRNLVYACSACNIQKGSSDGALFRASKLRKALPDVRADLRCMHKAVAKGEF
jgi:5-methylcytosine-specific restriction endonuclease McrA